MAEVKKTTRRIELLAPARDLQCAVEAVDHGADAVYIGAPQFSARAAAGNSVDDICRLASYAHTFGVRVYVALNTILTDSELSETEDLIWRLYEAGADALIVQDMGITELKLPPIPLHASTQMDNRSSAKVRFLSEAGFRQVVLARELSIGQIARIHADCPDVPLEVFVHGALCVSMSGQCYASEACFGRSANRGECAQFCRLPFSLVDSDGREIEHERHLLSLKDMNQLDLLEQLIDAGATSLKIEGRLKDASYVKNITAAYRAALDKIMARRTEYRRASSGTTTLSFTPQPEKSFNRGFTHYFLQGRQPDISCTDSPKSHGEPMGYVKELRGGYIVASGIKPFHNGDGVCYTDSTGHLQGFRVNRVDGNKLFPAGSMPNIKPKTALMRNYDQEFERVLSQKTAERKLDTRWLLQETPWGFALTATDEDGTMATLAFEHPKEEARKPQTENIKTQLSKLGGTVFRTRTDDIGINMTANWFIPSSILADWRRQVAERLLMLRRLRYRREIAVWQRTDHPFITDSLTYLGNVMNQKARRFYERHGVQHIDDAFEKHHVPDSVIMFCRHCLRYSMGWCPTHQHGKSPYREPYYLKGTDGHTFRLDFDCRNCMMKVVNTAKP